MCCQDHPRVCGNHAGESHQAAQVRGSPPRVREPHISTWLQLIITGITPACAGTTTALGRNDQGHVDHPRVCGNHSTLTIALSLAVGSPPRVREPLISAIDADEAVRITPACAGTTSRSKSKIFASGDHPRVCGNHVSSTLMICVKLGSPPRVREPHNHSL